MQGTALPLVLAVIIALSIVMSASYSLLRARYVLTKKSAAIYYEELDAHNATFVEEK
jgi:hypothetical protein